MMNTTVKDLTVTGKIIFPDGTYLDSSYSNLFSNFLNFQRNPTLGTTTLLNDKFLVSNVIETASDVLTPTLKSQSIHFLNDDDINGNPIVQTKAFSDSLKTELQTNTSELNSLITDHFDRPNKRMRITDGTNTSTYGSNFITINNSSYTDLGVNIPAGTFSLTKGISSPRIVFTNATLQLLVDASSSLGCIILTQGGDIRIIPKTQTIHIGTIRLQGNLQMESTAQISNAIMTGNVSFSSATSIEGLNKSHVNLDQVNNTSDLDKPISTATQSALNLKANLNSPSFTGTVTGITQTMVGLGNVNNTSDVNKPISSATQSALNLKANLASPSFSGSVIMNSLEVSGTALSLINVLNSSSFAGYFMGVATANGQLNGMVQTNDSVIMSKGTPSGSSTGNGQGFGKLTIATWSAFRNGIRITANETYNAGLDVWQDNGNKIEIECGASKYTQTASAFSVNKDFSITGNLSVTGSVTGITKSSVGLGNVDNTSDLNKPVSTATQSALNLKADLASPTFTGTVSGITKSMVGLSNVDNTSDANKPVSTATQTALNLKANLASPTFTGTVSGITKSMVGLSNVDNTSDADKPVSTATQTALNAKANQWSPSFGGIITMPDGKQQTKAFTDEWEQKVRLLGIGSAAVLPDTVALTSATFHNVSSVVLPVGFFILTVHACVAVINGNTTIGQIAAGYSTSTTAWSQSNQLAIQHLAGGNFNIGNQWVLHSTAIVQNTTARNYYLLVECVFGTAGRLQFVGQNSRFEYMRISNSGLW